MSRNILLRCLLGGALLMLLIPPWRSSIPQQDLAGNTVPEMFYGYEFVWEPSRDQRSWINGHALPIDRVIDWPRMGLQFLAVGALAGLGLALVKP